MIFQLVAVAAVIAVSSFAQSSSADDHAIRDLVAAYVSARNADSPEQVRALFTPDADQIVSTGQWRKSLDSIVRGTGTSSQKERSRSIKVESIRFIDRDVAIVDGRYETILLDGSARDMRTTLIVKRTPAGWRVAAIRNMKPAD